MLGSLLIGGTTRDPGDPPGDGPASQQKDPELPFRLLTPIDYARLIIGWLAVLLLPEGPALPLLGIIIAVIIFCAFGVVKMAERLARILGDPFGSLILTLSIVVIEVILIVAVMLGPGESATIARDSVTAVSMIIMALVVGLALLIGGLRHGGMAHNGTGTPTYLSLIAALLAVSFALPLLLGDGSFSTGQALFISLATIALYAFFLWRQTGAQAADFREVGAPETTTDRAGAEVAFRAFILVATVLPIVLLSHDMAVHMDTVLGQLGAPVALAGLLIAMIVFLPETITTLRAAWWGEIQRVSNLAHGALVSTVGLTIPAVLLIGVGTGSEVVLGESPVNLLLLGVTVAVSVIAFGARRVNAVHGAVLLLLFGVYLMSVFS